MDKMSESKTEKRKDYMENLMKVACFSRDLTNAIVINSSKNTHKNPYGITIK